MGKAVSSVQFINFGSSSGAIQQQYQSLNQFLINSSYTMVHLETAQHPLLDRVETALNNIRPFLKSDHGDVRVINITPENEVQVELMGACETCPMSAMTMKAGIEDAIRSAVPEIIKVVAINKV